MYIYTLNLRRPFFILVVALKRDIYRAGIYVQLVPKPLFFSRFLFHFARYIRVSKKSRVKALPALRKGILA